MNKQLIKDLLYIQNLINDSIKNQIYEILREKDFNQKEFENHIEYILKENLKFYNGDDNE